MILVVLLVAAWAPPAYGAAPAAPSADVKACLDTALQEAAKLPATSAYERVEVLTAVARLQAQSGNKHAARQTVQQARDAMDAAGAQARSKEAKSDAAAMIVDALAAVGDYEAAVAAAAKLAT